MVFANMAYNPPPITHLKRQTNIHPPPPPHMGGMGMAPCPSDMGSPDRRGVPAMQQQQSSQQQQQQQAQQQQQQPVSSAGSVAASSVSSTSNGFHQVDGLGQQAMGGLAHSAHGQGLGHSAK